MARNPGFKKAAPLVVETDLQGAPLYSAEAEKAILGSILMSPNEVIDHVCEKIGTDDFFVPAHRSIFEALKSLHDRRQAIDPMTVHQYLLDLKIADNVGSPGILAEMAAGVPTHLNVGSYIHIVKSKSLLRHLQSACQTISQNIADSTAQAEKILDDAGAKIFEVTDRAFTNSTVKASEKLEGTLNLIESFRQQQGRLSGIPTGFVELDLLTTGWQKGDMNVLAARPGVGKTALALTFARNALKERYDRESDAWIKPGFSVGFFSLEMANAQIMLRLLASYGSISLQKIRHGELDDSTMHSLRQFAEDIKEYPLYLDDSSSLTITQLRAKARRMKDRYKIDLLIIDYLQLLRSDSEQARDNRQNEVAEISRGIKALAKELEIPIVVLAQLNRKSEEGKSEPALHNLRESGAIEQDADMVMLLHREETDNTEGGGIFMLPYKLIIAKQRNGPTAHIEMTYNASCTRFEDPKKNERT